MLMMKRLALLLLLITLPAYGRGKLQGWVQLGGQKVQAGNGQSLNYFLRSFPGATVTVYNAGTLTPATIYSDAAGTAKSSSFAADNTGFWSFWAEDGDYDVAITGSVAYTLTSLRINSGLGSPPVTIGTGTSLVDGSTWATTSNLRMNFFNTATQGNKFVADFQLNIGAGVGGVNSESGALIARCKTANASGANTYDCVGADLRGIAGGVNQTARLWGGYLESSFPAGTDGAGTAIESVQNNSATTDQPNVNTITSKGIISVIAAGTQNATTGLYLIGVAPAKIHKGIYIEPETALANGATDAFIEMFGGTASADIFKITRDGYVTAPRMSTTPVGTTGALTSRPTVTLASFGAAPATLFSAGSSDFAGELVITAGVGAGSSGSVTLNYSTAIGAFANGSMCTATLRNGSGVWGLISTITGGICNTTSCNLILNNLAYSAGTVVPTAFTNGSTYALEYICVGR
jgi:hypothetical protein